MTDNRYSPGAAGVDAPAEAPASYSARWIDRGYRAEVLPDRQGFAYNDMADRNRLIDLLRQADLASALPDLHPDLPTEVGTGEWSVWMRRAGGYIYVEAWLVPAVVTRRAIIRGGDATRVARYLPENYVVMREEADGDVLIAGYDSAGWTLDGYVLPRLSSGLMFGTEVTS